MDALIFALSFHLESIKLTVDGLEFEILSDIEEHW